ncbi:hypothetical protein ATANTOWER_009720 [Ataeniobius toweri]|uniref:Uncharacterized protein n=1 Tax=Ataeniobius toweri TaxID=208326 RepID=A0ABU7AZF5_9TELE|nr:hypothetical protein [Ataeniobius toweri]
MPKTTCYQCCKVMPLHMLAVHIKTCTGKGDSEESRCEVVCPICNSEFPDEKITVHASLCGESFASTAPTAQDSGMCSAKTPECTPKSMEDVLCFLEQQVDATKEFKLCVAREDLPDRGILQWKWKKTASPTGALKVVFSQRC